MSAPDYLALGLPEVQIPIPAKFDPSRSTPASDHVFPVETIQYRDTTLRLYGALKALAPALTVTPKDETTTPNTKEP